MLNGTTWLTTRLPSFYFCRSDTLSSVNFCLSIREIGCSLSLWNYTRLQPLTYIMLRSCVCVLIKTQFHAFCTFSAYFIVLLLQIVSTWNQIGVLQWKSFMMFVTVLMIPINHEHEYIIVHSLRYYADNTGIFISIKSSSFTQSEIKYWDFSKRCITTCQKKPTLSASWKHSALY